MKKIQVLDIKDINPYIRDAGLQGNDSWPDRERKIYDHELLYCTGGKASIWINNKTHNIKRGSLILVGPNTPTKLTLDPTNPGKLYWVHFDFIFIDDDPHINHYLKQNSSVLFHKELPDHELIRPHLILTNGYQFPDVLVIKNGTEAERLFHELATCFLEKDPYRYLDGKVLLLKIIKLILEQTYAPSKDDEGYTANTAHVTPRVIHYIHSHYFDKITLREISSYIDLSPDYIGKLFKKETGKSIITYLNDYRLEKAKQLLLHSPLSMKEIADIVGFSDQYYFSKRMKAQTGSAPLHWKNEKLTELYK